jgi:glucose-1-phosphate adenylyltransferase
MAPLQHTLAVIMGGGRGARLYPLTKERSKPAVPIAGRYRLIDIPISNCINSGIYRIAVLTQFNSVSLHRHITNSYVFDPFRTGWVQIWAAEQTITSEDWYQGTADAVRKQLFEIRSTRADYILILAGDQLYRMDYSEMIDFHVSSGADVTIAVQPIDKKDAGRLGILKRNDTMRITRFAEKTTDPDVLSEMVSRDDLDRPFLGSMGIYVFNARILFEMLKQNTGSDFGRDIIPEAIHTHAVMGFDHDDYWEDIGTIRSFYETNLALARPNPPFSFFDSDHPIYTHARFLPGSIVENSTMTNVLIAEGCRVRNANISNSVLGVRSHICEGVNISNSVLMGADYYTPPVCQGDTDSTAIQIGCFSQIDGAIVDKNARIGDHVVIRPFPRGTDIDEERWVVRDGIVVIPKGAIIPPGTYIGPDMPLEAFARLRNT